MAETFANDAEGTLFAQLNAGATSLTLNSGHGAEFPSTGNFRLKIDNEIILAGARSGDTISSLSRGQEGTSDVTHSAGATVTHLITKGMLERFVQKDLVDAKGDLIVATGADAVARKAVGADNNVLVADSSQSDGLNWGGAWGTYVPTWTSTGTAPALGNGTLSGRFAQIGKTVHFNLKFIAGSTTTFGTGSWIFSIPVAAGGLGTANFPMGVSEAVDVSANQNYAGQAIQGGGGVVVTSPAAPGVLYTNTAPFTWANTDYFLLFGTYEAA